MGRPEGFTGRLDLPRCEICKFVFMRGNWEERDEFFCHYDKSKRPRCLSGAMNESLFSDAGMKMVSDAAYTLAREEWEKWAEERMVPSIGICPCFEKKDLGPWTLMI